MDDQAFPIKVTDEPSGDEPQGKIDEVLEKLPGDLETPLVPPTDVLPPVSPPPPPPSIPPTPDPVVSKVELEKPEEIESPEKKMSKGSGKKLAKIAGGLLMVLLVVGGLFLGRQAIQQRQVTVKEAKLPDPHDTGGVVDTGGGGKAGVSVKPGFLDNTGRVYSDFTNRLIKELSKVGVESSVTFGNPKIVRTSSGLSVTGFTIDGKTLQRPPTREVLPPGTKITDEDCYDNGVYQYCGIRGQGGFCGKGLFQSGEGCKQLLLRYNGGHAWCGDVIKNADGTYVEGDAAIGDSCVEGFVPKNIYYCPGDFDKYDSGCNDYLGVLSWEDFKNGNFCGTAQGDTANSFISKVSDAGCYESVGGEEGGGGDESGPYPSPTPSPVPITCYDQCTTDAQCSGALKCQAVSGVNRCVNVTCPAESDCICPSYLCTGLTGGTAVELGDTETFTCTGGNFSSLNPVAYFRQQIDGNPLYKTSVAIPLNATTLSASYDITIDQPGNWLVQCQVCTDNTQTDCTTWGQAN